LERCSSYRGEMPMYRGACGPPRVRMRRANHRAD
jgi:hypothetical protein